MIISRHHSFCDFGGLASGIDDDTETNRHVTEITSSPYVEKLAVRPAKLPEANLHKPDSLPSELIRLK